MRRKALISHRLGRILPAALLLVLACSEDDSSPTTPAGPSLDRFAVAFEGRLVAGRPAAVTVTAIGTDGSAPFTAFGGAVTLSLSEGTITPGTLPIDGGLGTSNVTVDGTYGPDVILTVTAGEATTTSPLPSVLLSALPGDPDADAIAAIPTFELVPEDGDHRTDHPDLPGIALSPTLLLLAFTEGTTVGTANDLLAAHDAIVAGGLPGVVALRIDSDDHAATSALIDELRGDPRVAAVAPDVLLAATVIPRANGGTPADWTWEAAPGSGNWGLERIRVPALWNLNPSLAKLGRHTRVGVIDAGFDVGHPDVAMSHQGFLRIHDHGMHVAGIVGATHDNGVGVDGVDPFVELVTVSPSFGGLLGRISWGQTMSGALTDLIRAENPVRVINLSLGYNWYAADIDPMESVAAQALAAAQGDLLATSLELLELIGPLPLICVAAGNEGSSTSVPEARFSSPMTAAALLHGIDDIVVVENVANSPGTADGDVTRSTSSCVGGDLSAPGDGILSTVDGNGYGTKTGTSMASPHVAGLASYLATLDPSLTNAQLRELLLSNRKSAGGGASDRIDAWAAAVEIDGLVGGDAILRALADLDDGTLDGNQRVDPATGADFTDRDADGDGGDGDGAVDMADFRRWRDWLLQASADPDATLDGSAAHPKKDLNHDGDVGSAAEESRYPRGDLNGDGIISRTATSYYPGALDREVTDLEVLQELFSDPDHDASELPGLIDSGDLTVDGSLLVTLPDAALVEVGVRRALDGTVVATRDLDVAHPVVVITVPSDATGYDLTVEVRDAGFVELLEDTTSVTVQKGEDHHWKPGPEPVLFVEVTASESVEVEDFFPIVVRAGTEDPAGTRTYLEGVSISLALPGGSLSSGGGTTDAAGGYETSGALDATTTVATLFATASLAGYEDVTASTTIASTDAIPEVYLTARRSCGIASTMVSLRGSGEHPSISDADATEDVVTDLSVDATAFPFTASSTGTTMYGTTELMGNASASVQHQALIRRAAGRVVGWEGSSSASSSAMGQGVGTFGFDEVWATSYGLEELTLQVNQETQLLLTVDALTASGGGGNRSAWVLRPATGGSPLLAVPATDEPQEFDVLIPPGTYRVTANAITVVTVSATCGCTSGAGTASATWSAQFRRP